MKTSMKIAGALLAGWAGLAGAQPPAGDADIRHGRYLIQTSGCNDCHTAGYMQKNGQVSEAEWLTGDSMGWQGPWGTTYAANLRLLFQQMDEQAWLAWPRPAGARHRPAEPPAAPPARRGGGHRSPARPRRRG